MKLYRSRAFIGVHAAALVTMGQTEGTSSKFWQVSQTDGVLTIRYSRIGTQGQTMTKSFDTVQKATAEREKLFAEKLRKGYEPA